MAIRAINVPALKKRILELQNHKCSKCGDWIPRDEVHLIYQITYRKMKTEEITEEKEVAVHKKCAGGVGTRT
jgi:hypothetical protein